MELIAESQIEFVNPMNVCSININPNNYLFKSIPWKQACKQTNRRAGENERACVHNYEDETKY